MTGPFSITDMEPLDWPHWDGLRERRLLLQRCLVCGRWYFPATRCACSPESAMEWAQSSGRGRLHAFAVFHQAYAPHLRDQLPYTVCVVELEEGPLMVSRLNAPAGYSPRIDEPVVVEFNVPEDGLATHAFRPVD